VVFAAVFPVGGEQDGDVMIAAHVAGGVLGFICVIIGIDRG
jgi:hypothetical protein